jgi:hypothetical protein
MRSFRIVSRPQSTARCGGPTTLALQIDPLGEKPAMKVFRFGTCERMTWMPQQLNA